MQKYQEWGRMPGTLAVIPATLESQEAEAGELHECRYLRLLSATKKQSMQ